MRIKLRGRSFDDMGNFYQIFNEFYPFAIISNTGFVYEEGDCSTGCCSRMTGMIIEITFSNYKIGL